MNNKPVVKPVEKQSSSQIDMCLNKSAFLGFGPTDSKTTIAGIEIIEISNGLIVKQWGEWDVGEHQFNAKSNL